MKKNLFKLLTAATLVAATLSVTNAQLMAVNLKSNLPQLQAYIASFDDEKTKEERASIKLTKANARALKDFCFNFKNGPDVKWTVEKNCISASFRRDDVQTFSVYDKQGEWLRNMSYYNEAKMPEDVRKMIKRSEFFDYKITGVQEINEQDVLFYIVHLEDGKNYKQLCVFNGQYDVIKEFKLSL